MERIAPDPGHAVRDGDRGQGVAALERIAPDAGHTVRNDDRGHAVAVLERIAPDAGHSMAGLHFTQHVAVHTAVIACAAQHAVRTGAAPQPQRTPLGGVQGDDVIPDLRVVVGGVHVPGTRQGLRRAPVPPVDGHAVGRRLADVQRHILAARGGNGDVKPGLSIIGHVHLAHVHGPVGGFQILQGPVPALSGEAVVGGVGGQGALPGQFLQRPRLHQGSVVVVKIDVLGGDGGRGSASPSRRDQDIAVAVFPRSQETLGSTAINRDFNVRHYSTSPL